jgi:HPt (histidine-containing phosphotransfer) domain-containing protein
MTTAMYTGPDRRFRPLRRERWLAVMANRSEDNPMASHSAILDEKVILQLVEDIGLDNTRKFLQSLDNEFQKRINSIRRGKEEGSFAILATEAHALKSSAQISGAFKLAEVLIKLETTATRNNNDAFALAQEALTLADLTRFAFLDVKLGK